MKKIKEKKELDYSRMPEHIWEKQLGGVYRVYEPTCRTSEKRFRHRKLPTACSRIERKGERMTTLSEAKRELAQLAIRQAELQRIIDTTPASLLVHGGHSTIGGVMVHDAVETQEIADAWAEALDTLLLLRQQPGTVAPSNDYQYVLEYDEDQIITDWFSSKRYKFTRISPCFTSEARARIAMSAVGEERLIRMFRVLHGGVV